MAPASAWRMKKIDEWPRSLAGLQQSNTLPCPAETVKLRDLWASIILFEWSDQTKTCELPCPLSPEASELDSGSLSSRRGLLLEHGNSLSWYINASTATGTGNYQKTHTRTHTQRDHCSGKHFLSADSICEPLVITVESILSYLVLCMKQSLYLSGSVMVCSHEAMQTMLTA